MINLTNIAEDETFEIPFNDINEVLKMVRKLEKLGIIKNIGYRLSPPFGESLYDYLY
ncbi:hypothetical protein J4225_00915 [Candidatus Pacearchaeota archaeon]|nr:hypothetical protein [Candidatus Pacearchaeota archaeon]